MFKFLLFVIFIVSSLASERLPKALTIYNEYQNVFASSSKKFLKEELFKNHAIFKGGCSLQVSGENYICEKENIELRAQEVPVSNKLFHLKLYEICRALVKEELNVLAFAKRFKLKELDANELGSLHRYFYPFQDKGDLVAKVGKNLEGFSASKKIETLFVTYCTDPGWL